MQHSSLCALVKCFGQRNKKGLPTPKLNILKNNKLLCGTLSIKKLKGRLLIIINEAGGLINRLLVISMKNAFHKLYGAFLAAFFLIMGLSFLRSSDVINWSFWPNTLIELGVALLSLGLSVIFGFLSGRRFQFGVAIIEAGEPEIFARSWAAASGILIVLCAVGVIAYAVINH
jgi:hypothetical protein